MDPKPLSYVVVQACDRVSARLAKTLRRLAAWDRYKEALATNAKQPLASTPEYKMLTGRITEEKARQTRLQALLAEMKSSGKLPG